MPSSFDRSTVCSRTALYIMACTCVAASVAIGQPEPEPDPLPPRPVQQPDQVVAPEPEGPPELDVLTHRLLTTYGNEGAAQDLDALITHFASRAQAVRNDGGLPVVSYVFEHPLEIEDLERDLFDRVAAAATGGTLDVCAPLIAYGLGIFDETNAVYMRAQSVASEEDAAALDQEIFEFFAKVNDRRTREADHLLDFARFLRDAGETSASDRAKYADLLSDDFTSQGLPMLIGPDFLRLGEMANSLQEIVNTTDPIAAPEDVRAAVPQGLIHFAQQTPDGWIVVGSVLNNVYNMDKILIVFDPAGDDVYNYSEVQRAQIQAVFDLAGDDKHVGTADGAGPAAAVLGVSVLIDFEGDDLYSTTGSVSIGAGLFGSGLLIDHKGDDIYEMTGGSSAWGIGAGIHGSGMLIDREGDDTYISTGLGVGVGGCNGFGAVLDAMGRDTYIAKTSNENTGEYVHARTDFGFGAGVGVKDFAQGGFGVLYDLSGTDTYEVPTRATATDIAMAVFHDESGSDVLKVGRGVAATARATNLSIAIAIDNDGDDTYLGSIATADSDSIAVVFDRGGNDTYTSVEPTNSGPGGAEELVSSASNGSLAMLIDVNGDDTYTTFNSSPGQSGNDTFDPNNDTIARSFSFLFDLFGADTFTVSGERMVIDTSAFMLPSKPARNPDSTLTGSAYGLIVDTDEKPEPKRKIGTVGP